MSAELKCVVIAYTADCFHTHIQGSSRTPQRVCPSGFLPAVRQAAQIMAVMFPSIWLLGFPEQDCKVSQKVVHGFPCMAF